MTYHLSSPPGICEVCIPQSFILYAVLCKSLFVLLSFFICPCTLLSAFLQITAPEYHFGFFILCLIYNFISWKINKLGFCFKCVFKGDLRRVQLLDQELPTLPEHLGSLPIFSGVCVTRSLVLYVCFVDRCLYFFFWPLCCLFFFDIRILITPLVSSNSSYKKEDTRCFIILLGTTIVTLYDNTDNTDCHMSVQLKGISSD
jgi:hypothetical protein